MILCLLKATWALAWEPALPGIVYAVFLCLCVTTVTSSYQPSTLYHIKLESILKRSRRGVFPCYDNTEPLKHMFIAVLFHNPYSCWLLMAMIQKTNFIFSGIYSFSEYLQGLSSLRVSYWSRN